ncbi:MAG: DUF1292 domain-containing protein [Clostridia bacterium]|nr:DUF1292 domain-containing protein [Clostridia bacterium]
MTDKFENIENGTQETENDFLVDLYDDDGNKQTVEHLDTVQVDGSDYVICIPYKEQEDDEVDEVIILKMEYDENDDYILVPEEDLEILDRAYELFKERNADLFDFED